MNEVHQLEVGGRTRVLGAHRESKRPDDHPHLPKTLMRNSMDLAGSLHAVLRFDGLAVKTRDQAVEAILAYRPYCEGRGN